MSFSPLRIVIATAVLCLAAVPALAQVPSVSAATLINSVGSPVTAEQVASMHDLSARFAPNFPIPVQVLHMQVDLDLRGEPCPGDALFYVENGVVQRVRLYIWPRDGSKFWDQSPRDQRILFDRLAMLMYEAADPSILTKPTTYDLGAFSTFLDAKSHYYYLSLYTGNQLSLEISNQSFNDRLGTADLTFDPGRWEGYP